MIRIAEQYGLTKLVAKQYTGSNLVDINEKHRNYTQALSNIRSFILQHHGIIVEPAIDKGARKLTITVTIDTCMK